MQRVSDAGFGGLSLKRFAVSVDKSTGRWDGGLVIHRCRFLSLVLRLPRRWWVYPGVSRLDYDAVHEGGYFPVRIESNCDTEIARWLERHPKVSRVLPGLESHPQHALALRQT